MYASFSSVIWEIIIGRSGNLVKNFQFRFSFSQISEKKNFRKQNGKTKSTSGGTEEERAVFSSFVEKLRSNQP